MKYRRIVTGAFFVLLAIVAVVFVPKQSEPKSSKLQVLASFYPLYYFAQEIGGAYVDVKNLTPAGVEPHDYEPTAKDLAAMQNSGIVILIGNGFEPWSSILKDSDNTTLEVSEDLISQNSDPHIWLSPKQALKISQKILETFVANDQLNARYYEANYEALKAKLVYLDKSYQLELKVCKSRAFVTSHDAFGYLAESYSLRQMAISGLSPEEEPSIAQLKEVADFARKNNTKYIFFESLVSPKLSETVAREVGAQTLVLNPLEGLTAKEISAGKDYLTIMFENLDNLKLALECTK